MLLFRFGAGGEHGGDGGQTEGGGQHQQVAVRAGQRHLRAGRGVHRQGRQGQDRALQGLRPYQTPAERTRRKQVSHFGGGVGLGCEGGEGGLR